MCVEIVDFGESHKMINVYIYIYIYIYMYGWIQRTIDNKVI